MARMTRPLPRPTDTELAILRVLWEHGPATVRQVHEVLAERPRDRLHDDAEADADHGGEGAGHPRRVHPDTRVRRRGSARDETQRQLVSDLVDRAFGGSAAALVMQALNAHSTSPQELKEIEEVIEDYKEGLK